VLGTNFPNRVNYVLCYFSHTSAEGATAQVGAMKENAYNSARIGNRAQLIIRQIAPMIIH
jgi:hypothetical protein